MTHRLILLLLALLAALPARAADDFSVAERALFMTNHLAALKPPATLHYSFRKTGSLEEGFEDKVAIALRAQPDGHCCSAEAQFLAGPRRVNLPEVEAAEGNPAIMYFLEHDIREMNRLTKGQANYFRRRIKLAVYQGAAVRDTTVAWSGRQVPAREISFSPYTDDPLRARFEQLAGKRYEFVLSDAVPGGVYAIRTRVEGAGPDAPLLVEEMLVEGAARQP